MHRYHKSNLSLGDDVGTLYVSDTNVLRAINDDSIQYVHEILTNGLLNELIDRGLFPRTRISDLEMDGYKLVIEHEKIKPVIYPFEWSPEMLKRAALCVLEVNYCANKYGYELKDAHPYNVIFKYNKPVFVDFGSFIKQDFSYITWTAYDEFMGSFYYPLRVCEKRLTSLYKHIFLISGVGPGTAELSAILHPAYAFVGADFIKNIHKLISAYRRGPDLSNDKINSRFKNPLVNLLVKFVLRSRILPFRRVNIDSLEKKIVSLNISGKSAWANYHETSGFYSKDGKVMLSPRMNWVRDIVSELRPKTIIELAGNQGILSRVLSKEAGVESVICTDYDENSINALLLKSRNDEKVSMACFNFMSEAWQLLSNERQVRLRSEMVIALAITHHLILSQNYNIKQILRTITSFSSKYVIIEFMPLGLWDGITAPPIPDWYNENWFVGNLSNYCDIIKRKEIQKNRITYLARNKEDIISS